MRGTTFYLFIKWMEELLCRCQEWNRNTPEIQHSSWVSTSPIDINTDFETIFLHFESLGLKVVKLTGLYIPSSQLGPTVPFWRRVILFYLFTLSMWHSSSEGSKPNNHHSKSSGWMLIHTYICHWMLTLVPMISPTFYSIPGVSVNSSTHFKVYSHQKF